MPDATTTESLDRRSFTKRIVGGAVAAPIAASAITDNLDAAEPVQQPASNSAPPPQREEDLYLALVKQLDPNRLQPEHLKKIRDDIVAQLARSKRLSGFPLTNADEPAPVFSAWRAEG
ncbi:MAG TPA: hypothetical protein VJ783_30075 [Pirellulales bacterium]|nr:hypothetical protein [Pirellulales bacterium]